MAGIARFTCAFIASAALAGAALACDGSNDAGGGAFATAIRRVPAVALDTDESVRTVSMIDLRRVRAALAPGKSTDDSFVNTLIGLQDAGIVSPGTLWSFQLGYLLRVLPLWRAAGIDPDNFDLLLEAGLPPQLLSVAFGTFDAGRTAGYFRDCTGCPEPETITHGGAEVFTWGDPHQPSDRRLAPPLFDQFGRGGAVAVTNTAAIRGYSVATVENTLDALRGKGAILAADDHFVLLADALDQAHTLNAYISDGISQQAGTPAPGEVTLRPYTAFAVGQRLDGGEAVMVIALAHGSKAAAAENATRFKERIATARSAITGAPWSGLFSAVTTTTEGPIMIAILRGPGARTWIQFVLIEDPLLLFER